MGYIRHRLLIDQLPILEPARSETLGAFEAWRSGLPDDWQRLVIGPVKALANGDEWVIFLPDGSKEGWDVSEQGYEYAQQFVSLMRDRWSEPLEVTWGDDDVSARVGLSFGDE